MVNSLISIYVLDSIGEPNNDAKVLMSLSLAVSQVIDRVQIVVNQPCSCTQDYCSWINALPV